MLPEEYRNRIIQADVIDTLKQLPDQCIDLIYGDPDYNIGIKYDGRAYTASWDEYIQWYIDLARESRRAVQDDGNLYLSKYPKQNAHLRVKFLDERAYAVHEYVWVYNTNVGHSSRRFTTAHRSILHAVKSKRNKFYKEQVAQPYKNPADRRIQDRIRQGHTGRMPYSWLNFNLVKNVSRQKADHPCQIPEGLSELLLKSGTKPGDAVFILFGGSGSETALAQRLGLTWLTCELQPYYTEIIAGRLSRAGELAPEHRHPARRNKKERKK